MFLLVLSLVFVFGMRTKGSLNPFFFNVSKYNDVTFWKVHLRDERSDSLLLIDIDLVNSLKKLFSMVRAFIDVGRMDCLVRLISVRLISAITKSKVMSRKFTICKLALVVILSQQYLNTFITFFFTLSVFGPDKPFNIARPSRLYNPTE